MPGVSAALSGNLRDSASLRGTARRHRAEGLAVLLSLPTMRARIGPPQELDFPEPANSKDAVAAACEAQHRAFSGRGWIGG